MTVTENCPKCGVPLDDQTAGLCPRCLGGLAFGVMDEVTGDANSPPPRLHRLGDYELIREIARGGMGVVYEARQLSLNRIVAVKVVLHGPFSSPEFVQRFRTETAATAALQHPNIVAIYEVGQAGDNHFFSMEYIEGQNLAELTREQPLPSRRAAKYLKTIAETVHYAHQHGVLHRDLKPSNVLLDVFDQPRITDFGLAKLVGTDAELTTTGQVLGSPNYIAPEQAAGKQSGTGVSADIYSLGAILYHLLTGRPPFQGETLPEILRQVQDTDPVAPRRLNPSVPVDLQTICFKCLQKEPARRYESAQELAADLGHFLANEPIHARAVSPVEKIWMWCGRRPALATLIVAIHLVLLLGIIGVLWQWQRAEESAQGEYQQRLVAEDFAARVRLNLYAGDVSFAAQALGRGDLGLARRTLAEFIPAAGEEDLRGFEWRYLWEQCRGDQLVTLGEHEWIVTCVAFSPDGKYVASGSQDQTVKIWDVAERKLVTTLAAATGAVWSVAFTPDARQLVTSGVGGTRLWDCDSWQLVREFPGQTASLARTAPLVAVAEVAFLYWWQPPGEVSVWNYLTGERIRTLPKPGRAVALSPDGQTLAVSDHPRNVDVYDLATGTVRHTVTTLNPVRQLTFSPDGSRLTIVGGSRNPILLDLRAPITERQLAAHDMEAWAAVFSPDGTALASTSSDQTLRLTDADTLELKTILHGHEHEVWCVAFSPDGQLLATGGKDRKVMLWSGAGRPAPKIVPSPASARPLFAPDGRHLLAGGDSGTRAPSVLWNVDDLTPTLELRGRRPVGFSPDGQHLVRWAAAGGALEWVAVSGNIARTISLGGLDEQSRNLQRQGFSTDWNYFFAVDGAGRAGIWNATTGELLGGCQDLPLPISAGALSPGGRYLALGSQTETVVRLYDREANATRQLAAHHDTIRGLAFSPDGATLASGSLDGTIRLWNATNGAAIAELPGHMEETSDVAFSPDGRTLVSVNVGLSVKLWHLATRRQLVSWEFPEAGDFVRFSPDGRYLAITTRTNSIHLFAAPSLEALDSAGR